MKVILLVGTLLIFLAGMAEAQEQLSYGEVLEGLNPLYFNPVVSCGDGTNNSIALRAWMGPCCQTKWCKIPECCGIIAGRDSIFQMEYIASRYVRIGTFSGDVGGICIQEQNPQNGTRCNLTVPFPVHVQVPQYLANYPSNLCNISVCPQYESETYNITVPFRFATTVLTSSIVWANFVAVVYDEFLKTLLCWGLWGQLVNEDLLSSVNKTLNNTILDPIGVISDPIGTIFGPLFG